MGSKNEEILEEFKNFKAEKINHYKSSLTALCTKNQNNQENDPNKSTFSKVFMLNLKKSLEENMKTSVKLNKSLFNKEIREMLLFLFWAVENDLIDSVSYWVFLEDLYESLCLKDVSLLFDFLEENFMKLPKPNAPILLRVCNSLLKKLSKVNDANLRGRVLVLLSKMLPISHESGTNLKSACDTTPIIFEKDVGKEENKFEKLNFNTYLKFWSIQKFLQNPLAIFNEEEEDDESNLILFRDENAMEIEENKENDKDLVNEKETIPNNKQKKHDEKNPINTKNTRFNRCFEKVLNIIEIFNSNPIEFDQNQNFVFKKNYPRFLPNSELLETQFKDASFRKVWLTQVLLAINSLKSPIKINPNKNYILLADQRKTLEKIEEKIHKQLDSLTIIQNPDENVDDKLIQKNNTPSQNIENFLQKEKLWQEWKENNCPIFEKPPSKEMQEALSLWTEYRNSAKYMKIEKPLSMNPHKEKKKFLKTSKENGKAFSHDFCSKITEKTSKIVQENIVNLRRSGMFDLNTELFKFLDFSKIEISEEPIEPSVAFFFDKIYYDMDPLNEVQEEDKIKKDINYIWKGLRILSRNDLTPFKANTNNDFTSDCIIDEIARKLKNISSSPINKESTDNLKENEGKSAPQMETEENISVKTGEKDKTAAPEKEKTSAVHEKTSIAHEKNTVALEKSTVIQEKTTSNTKILTTAGKAKESNVISLKRNAAEDQDIEQLKTKPSKILKK